MLKLASYQLRSGRREGATDITRLERLLSASLSSIVSKNFQVTSFNSVKNILDHPWKRPVWVG